MGYLSANFLFLFCSMEGEYSPCGYYRMQAIKLDIKEFTIDCGEFS